MQLQHGVRGDKGTKSIHNIVCSDNQSAPRSFCISEYITETSKGIEATQTWLESELKWWHNTLFF